ncbi:MULTISPECIES: AAA family ATPase [unclassified Ensifer]|uniref:AAA family ATPase n=1 Tax=unclassified Ensifer TaxID=2633371 RepID=UPI0008131D06|nr:MULTISPECIES: AAA family ATPase [unclassified Ensifer]OCP19675.1 hypothetical protein BC361_30185 [Ensifer sp. LC54]OCP19705.1 hypothetical protein BC363_30485 [Ensifer sp. LC384]
MSKKEKAKGERKQSSAYEFALKCCVGRAVRAATAFASGGPGLVVLIAPERTPVIDYVKSVTSLLNGGDADYLTRDLGLMCIDPKDRVAKVIGQFESECRDKRRAAVITAAKELVPAVIELAADAVVEIPPISARDLQAACRCVLNINVSHEQAEKALSFPHQLLWSALRIGRPIDESLRRLTEGAPKAAEARPTTAAPPLEQLPGYGEAKVWGLQLASDLAEWRDGKLDWADVDRGLLLSGPPGVGKTQFARSLAVTCDCHFIATSVAQWQAKGHLGDLLKAMRADFAEAREKAPAIIMLDELDSIGDRDTFSHDHASYSTQVVNSLLECLDGISGREGVIVVGATNNPSRIDPAVRRSGRLDRHFVIGLPTEEERVAILAHHLGGQLSMQELSALGPRMEGMSGADIEQLARDGRRVARKQRRHLQLDDIAAQLPEVILIDGFYRQTVAVHEAGHALVARHVGHAEFLGVFITRQLNPRLQEQRAGAAILRRRPVEFRDRQAYLNEICTYLGGIAAEQVVFGRHGDGAGTGDGNDLQRATKAACFVEANFGMGDRLRYRDAPERDWQGILQKDELLRKKVDEILETEFQRAKGLLEKHRNVLDLVAKELEECGQVTPEQIDAFERAVAPADESLAS